MKNYLVCGDDVYHRDQFLDQFSEYCVIEDDVDLAVSSAQSTGLFTSGVLLRLSSMTAKKADVILQASELPQFVIALKSKLDKRTKYAKTLAKVFKVKSFDLPREWDKRSIIPKIEKMAQRLSVRLDFGVADKLCTLYANDFYRIHNILCALSNCVRDTITSVEIECLQSEQTVIFDLAQHLVRKDTKSALYCVSQLQLEPDIKILSILLSQLTKFHQIKLGDSSYPSWQTQKVRQTMGSASLQDLLKLSDAVFQAQSEIKTGNTFDLQTFVIQETT